MRRTWAAWGVTALVAMGVVVPTVGADARLNTIPTRVASRTFVTLTFNLASECKDAPTTELRIDTPDGVALTKPIAKAGWTITTREGRLARPLRLRGQTFRRSIRRVVWKADTPLDDTLLDRFEISIYVTAPAGTTLYFPALQRCTGTRAVYDKLPPPAEWATTEGAAPFVIVTPNPAVSRVGPRAARPPVGRADQNGSPLIAMAAAIIATVALGLSSLALRTARRDGATEPEPRL